MATLNVKDALSYLDQVKVQFAEHPDVYNRFLDIMKDFKSQSIDTPGVIERVSTLFSGHPSLIQGFNTFLPPGYRIECSLDPDRANMITVTTPTGTTTQTSGGIAGAISRMHRDAGAAHAADAPSHADGGPPPMGAPGYGAAAGAPGAPGQPLPSLPAGSLSGLATPSRPSHAGAGPATPGATAGAGVLSAPFPSAAQNAADRRPPVEFNHAISYVNRIKQRFSGDPDTYKQFLEILQTYQKEQRPIGDVYAQVTVLFNNDKDLLDEFKQFLPDTSSGAPPAAGGLFGMLGQVTAGMGAPGVAAQAGPGGHQGAHGHHAGAQAPPGAARLDAGPPEGAKKAPGGGRSKKRAAGAASSTPTAEAAAPAPAAKSKSKKSKHSHAKLERSPARDQGGIVPVSAQEAYAPPMPMPPPGAQQALMYGSDGSLIPVPGGAPGVGLAMAPDGSLVPMGVGVNGVNGGMGLGPQAPPLATTDEVAFFDRVKKHIDDRATYLEFLKLLNLYTQDVIDVRTLVDRASLFIGGNRELFNAFQRLCGYDMGKHGWLEAEDPIIENVPALQRERVDLGSCKVYGASYRKLPKAEINLACSGRDPMCWEVLNDTWVSHPTWASEGESFNPHKKNVYEDALYRSEEERHEYDYHIEANLRTIALLEPIAARITTMDADERAAFRLKPGLGGQSKSIYQRVVKKVYGREHGVEVIAALHDNPCVAVPVVLARLKQKDEEWKRAQREWNKVWREVDARNYYKSLDHQGVNFKASDKKVITTKAFVSEIEAKRTQQLQARLAVDPNLPRPRPQHQLAYALDDTGVLMDVLKLALSFLDRAPYSRTDCDRIEGFLRTFVPLLLALDPQEFEEQLSGGVVLEGQADEEAESRAGDDEPRSDAEASDADTASVASTSRRGGAAARRQEGDLRRRLLRNQAEAAQGEAAPGDSAVAAAAARSSSPALAVEVKAATEAMDAATAPVVAGGAGAPDVEMLDGEAKAAAAQNLSEADGSAAPASKTSSDEEMPDASVEPDTTVNPAEPKTWLGAGGVKAFDSATKQNVATPPAADSAAPSPGGSAQPAAASIKCNFFCSTSHYVFVRLLQLLYARLFKMKQLGAEMAAQQPPKRRINPIALELGLQDGSTGPAAVVGAAAAARSEAASASHSSGTSSANGVQPNGASDGLSGDVSGLTLSPSRYYDTLLELAEKLFDGELDRNTFEESVRYMYGIEGYLTFTLDKVIGALVKTAQLIATDSKCQELQSILEKDRASGSSADYKAQIARRVAAEAVLGREENLFRVEWQAGSKQLLLQMLSKDEPTLGDPRTKEQRWAQYTASYVLYTPTEGLPSPVAPPFLQRTAPADVDEAELEAPRGGALIARNELSLKMCMNTYRLFYGAGTTDTFVRQLPAATLEARERHLTTQREARRKKLDEWLQARAAQLAPPATAATEDGAAPAGEAAAAARPAAAAP